jgi:hypothetical protein
MPFIKGVTDIGAPRSANWGIDQAGIALQVINPEAMERYAHEFTSATEPLNGILSRESLSRLLPGF